ncbi:MAG: hypothetical protein ACKVLG_01355 [Fidelibacterota bacterium]
MNYKTKNKKHQILLDDFIELGHKFDIEIIQDKGDFNGDSCMLFADNVVVIIRATITYFSKMF